jgi:hypothetical protein
VPRARDPNLLGKTSDASAPRRRRTGSLGSAPEGLEAAVGETVFRYQLQQPLVDSPPSPRYYLALRGHDPDEALLRQLSAVTPGIQPFSRCRVTARDGVLDRVSGARGVIVQVARFAWVHAAAVDVVGGYYITHRHAASFRYHVEPDGQQWAVTAVYLLWQV